MNDHARLDRLALLFMSIVCLVPLQRSLAVIIFEAPGRSESMPVLAGGVNPGWQYVGQLGAFSGTPIGPRAWVSATHLNMTTGSLLYDNAGTTALNSYASTRVTTSGDLAVYTLDTVVPDFTEWAPVWSDPNQLTANMDVYMYGRGTERGSEITNGWRWGGADTDLSFGTNQLSGLSAIGADMYLVMEFNEPTPSNGLPSTEGILSPGDSGGSIFGYNSNTARWELIGINYAVETVADQPNSNYINAAIYDARGYYVPNTPTLISWDTPVPLSSFSTSLPHKYAFLSPYIPVPEPGTFLFGGIGAVLLIYLWRRSYPNGPIRSVE